MKIGFVSAMLPELVHADVLDRRATPGRCIRMLKATQIMDLCGSWMRSQAGPILSIAALLFTGAAANAALLLTEDSKSLTIDNGVITMVFMKEGSDAGAIQSLTYRGRELFGGGGHGYVQIVCDARFPTRPAWRVGISRKEPALVEIEVKNTDPQCPFDLAAYYVVRAGEPGFFSYLSMGHDASRHPGAHVLTQYNTCLRVDPALFTTAAVDQTRVHPLPKPAALTPDRMVMDATYRLAEGDYYSKYFDSAEMNECHRVHGMMGSDVGLWIIMPSHEHMNGGPERQELTVHQTDSTPVLLRHATAAHYGGGTVRSDSKAGSWSKVSAPCFVYVNTAANARDLWADAQHRAEEEVARWPYAWLDDARFQLERGALHGRLVMGRDEPAAKAWVILAEHEESPGPLAWQQQWRGYRFHGRTASDGGFCIDKIRPGVYDLYAWGASRTGQFLRREVRITAGGTTELGEVSWLRPVGREVLWQIGDADRSAAEFAYGDDFRRWGLWDTIAAVHPDGVRFVVGQHHWRDLPFEMAVTQKDDLSWREPVWRIEFSCPELPTGRGVLTLGFAAFESIHPQHGAQLRLDLNGAEIAAIRDLAQAAAPHRGGVHAAYQEREIRFDLSLLRKGTNTLTMKMPAPGYMIKKRLGYPAAALLWDCLRLEVESGQVATDSEAVK